MKKLLVSEMLRVLGDRCGMGERALGTTGTGYIETIASQVLGKRRSMTDILNQLNVGVGFRV